ncbi:flagellar biosynthetic protein FliO [Neobacillus sp. YIM B02564]|uniref:Flagellar biosynthetic protein FliO n=1 Tax=Neobacillus paridis TaxID=2803862 RepID=A0ABS1TNQ5_9BACI|nr:flagellar biosynthetic protein FliO [Neobacillus paridis]MBL4952955.1 flagellar biosynthetic protein FliO [Neobacillus paridis]
MKRIMLLLAFVVNFVSYQPYILAAEYSAAGEPSVYDTIQKGDQSSKPSSSTVKDSGSSIFSLFIKFFISFVFVIFLLFVLLRYLAKRNRQLPANGPIIPLGDYPLGNNRSLQILLIGQTIYVVGVGETVTLLRTISQGEEYQHLLENLEDVVEEVPSKWLPEDTKKIWNNVFQKQLQNIKKHRGGE